MLALGPRRHAAAIGGGGEGGGRECAKERADSAGGHVAQPGMVMQQQLLDNRVGYLSWRIRVGGCRVGGGPVHLLDCAP